MLSAGIKINYGKISKNMGDSTLKFVQNATSSVPTNVTNASRIRISTMKVGEPFGSEGFMVMNIHPILRVAIKKAGLENIFKPWNVSYFEKSELNELFSLDNFLKALKN